VRLSAPRKPPWRYAARTGRIERMGDPRAAAAPLATDSTISTPAAAPFFAVATGDGVHLVNRAHVLNARPRLRHAGTARPIVEVMLREARRPAVFAAGRTGHAGERRQSRAKSPTAPHRSAHLCPDGRKSPAGSGGQIDQQAETGIRLRRGNGLVRCESCPRLAGSPRDFGDSPVYAEKSPRRRLRSRSRPENEPANARRSNPARPRPHLPQKPSAAGSPEGAAGIRHRRRRRWWTVPYPRRATSRGEFGSLEFQAAEEQKLGKLLRASAVRSRSDLHLRVGESAAVPHPWRDQTPSPARRSA